MKATGNILVDIAAALELRRIMRTKPKATREKRTKKFLKEFFNN